MLNKTMTSSPQFEPNQSQARYQAAITVTLRREGEMGKTVTGSESIWMRGGQLKRIFAVSFMCSVLLDWNAVRGSLKGLRMNMHRWSRAPAPGLCSQICVTSVPLPRPPETQSG